MVEQTSEKKDFSTAIMDKKKAPHKLQVEESKQDDNSVVEMTQAKMDELKIFKGDAVILKGKYLMTTFSNEFFPPRQKAQRDCVYRTHDRRGRCRRQPPPHEQGREEKLESQNGGHCFSPPLP